MPLSRSWKARKPRFTSRVYTELLRPYFTSLLMRNASSASLKRITESTGPKISCAAQRERAFLLPDLHVRFHLLQRALVDQRPHVHAVVVAVAQLQLLRTLGQALHEGVV